MHPHDWDEASDQCLLCGLKKIDIYRVPGWGAAACGSKEWIPKGSDPRAKARGKSAKKKPPGTIKYVFCRRAFKRKLAFSDRHDAVAKARELQKDGKMQSVYRCKTTKGGCGAYHLTSKRYDGTKYL